MKVLSMMRSVACLAFAFGAIMVLQGCGGGGPPAPPPTPPPPPPPPIVTTTTTTTVKFGPWPLHPAPWDPTLELPYCEEVVTFYAVHYGNMSVKTAYGQCKPSVNPGAFFTAPGEKGDDGKSDKPWSCWSKDFPKNLRTNAEAKLQKFFGACLMKDWKGGVAPDLKEVPFCSTKMDHHPASCSPGPSTFYGACWSHLTENWQCVPQGDQVLIDGYAQGDCKSAVAVEPMTGAPTRWFFDGFCRFEEQLLKTYKCDTVKTYNAGMATTCGQAVDESSDKACFSMIAGSQWQCLQPEEEWGTPCDWTRQPGGHSGAQAFYKGRCVYTRNKNYETALDASNINMTELFGHEMVV